MRARGGYVTCEMPESPNEFARELEEGRSETTPVLALTAVTITVAVFVVIVAGAALIAYYVF